MPLRGVEFLISSLIHHEVLRQLREHFGAAFDPEVILAGLRAKRVLEVVDFTVADAERLAARVNARFPSRDEWAGHKKQRACACLGLKDDVTSASGATCGATVDWLIGSHAERLDALMMTHDAGPEWTGVTRVSPKDVRRVLEAELARLS